MTLQQLKYIIAIDRHRSFVRAADELGITQPTLSSLLQKLESELDVCIFDRSNKSVAPTAVGQKILRQARRVVNEAERMTELVAEEKGSVTGPLNLSVGPTIAPYLLPRFIRTYTEMFPQVGLSIAEMKAEAMLDALRLGQLDAGIGIGGHVREGILEIPLYTEPFWVYIAESCWRKLPVFKPENLEHEQMWIMKESQCLRESAFSFCKARGVGKRIYEAGSVETLIRIVDENGGFTIIPEMHLSMLTEKQRQNVRRIEGDYLSQRRVSIYIREDFIRARMLDSVVGALAAFIPKKMLAERIAKHGVRL
ncbi:MAG: LysR family transcriptional regulator [Rikenellaceae bacterium]|nr:LysR family transcriptional regulator [Rikenellaceae bacterium]